MATDADVFAVRPDDPLSPVVYGIDIKSRARNRGGSGYGNVSAGASVRPLLQPPPPRAVVIAVSRKISDDFALSSGSETEDDVAPNKKVGGGGGDPILAAALAKKRRTEITALSPASGKKEKSKPRRERDVADASKNLKKKKKKKKFSEKYRDLIPPNRKYVAQARAADDISQMPAQPAAIDGCGMDPDDPDSKVPEPEACRGRYIIAYSQCIYRPGVPPHPQFDRFDTYEDWLIALVYRSMLWGDEHNKFMVASLAPAALGQNPNKTPEKAWQECRYPAALRNENEYSLYILERGVQIEPLHEHLFRVVDPKVCFFAKMQNFLYFPSERSCADADRSSTGPKSGYWRRRTPNFTKS